MDPLKQSIQSLGLELVYGKFNDEDLTIQLKNILKNCKSTKKIYLFTDIEDVSLLHNYQELDVNEDLISFIIWGDKNVQYISKNSLIDKKKWNLILTKGISKTCCICLESFENKTTPDNMCYTCLSTRCKFCVWKQHTPECPICREFDIDSYLNKRIRCMYFILTRSGLTRSIIDSKRSKTGKFNEFEKRLNKSMIKEHELFTGKSSTEEEISKIKICKENIEAYLDFEMIRYNENTYDIDHEKYSYKNLFDKLLSMGEAWDWCDMHE